MLKKLMNLLYLLIILVVAGCDANEGQLSSPDNFVNIAHRGASGHAPEHTLSAYELGEEMGGDYIELDLQMTADGSLVAIHDNTVDRTTDGTGFVGDLTLADLKTLDAGSWFNDTYPDQAREEYIGLEILTLEEILDVFGTEANYYIETKSPEMYPGIEETLLEILGDYDLLDPELPQGKVVIQSFSEDSLRKIHDMNEDLPLVQLISYRNIAEISAEEIETIKEYAVGIGLSYYYLTEDYVQQVQDAGLLIHPYTVDEQKDMEQLIDWGVNGMFTNYPDVLNEVLEKRS